MFLATSYVITIQPGVNWQSIIIMFVSLSCTVLSVIFFSGVIASKGDYNAYKRQYGDKEGLNAIRGDIITFSIIAIFLLIVSIALFYCLGYLKTKEMIEELSLEFSQNFDLEEVDLDWKDHSFKAITTTEEPISGSFYAMDDDNVYYITIDE